MEYDMFPSATYPLTKSASSTASEIDYNLVQKLKASHPIVGRHITWIKQPRDGYEKYLVLFLALVEITFLMSTGVGAKIVTRGFRISKKLDGYAKFEKIITNSIPEQKDITIKTKTESFNHLYQFVIHEKQLWFKSNGTTAWQRCYFDGFEEDRFPAELCADGANLVVVDDLGRVHYKKIAWEGRDNGYHFRSKVKKDNWKESWYTFPYISPFINFFLGKKLTLLPGCRAWAISHRGQFNYYYKDPLGNSHVDKTGVTTLYALDSDGKKIYYADPWLPFGFIYTIPFVPDPNFTAFNLKASASTLFLIGKNNHEIEMYTCEADFDILGHNPLKQYTRNPQNKDKTLCFIPPRSWKKEPKILLEKAAEINFDITILQTGEGNDARELRISGLDRKGNRGYYSKEIAGKESNDWRFIKTEV